jgi:uncharacterized protein (DUF983 family)
VHLPLFARRRRDPVTCTNCGVKLERVLPGVPYYTLSFIVAILIEIAMVPVLFLIFARQWSWIAVVIAAAVAINLAASAFLNARTRVEFVDPADGRRDLPGRWYPK